MGHAILAGKTTKRELGLEHGRAPAGTGGASLSSIWHA